MMDNKKLLIPDLLALAVPALALPITAWWGGWGWPSWCGWGQGRLGCGTCGRADGGGKLPLIDTEPTI